MDWPTPPKAQRGHSPLADARPRASRFCNDEFQRGLARWNRARLAPGFPDEDWPGAEERDGRMRRQEGQFLDALRADVADEAAGAPTDPNGFIAWFEALRDRGPGQNDPLFPWLARKPAEELRWFGAGGRGRAGFRICSLHPVGCRAGQARSRRNSAEMGRGQSKGMQGRCSNLIEASASGCDRRDRLESLAIANAMTDGATEYA